MRNFFRALWTNLLKLFTRKPEPREPERISYEEATKEDR
jgi:hypothetical protein